MAAELTCAERERLYRELTHEERLSVDCDFASFAHDAQRAPDGDWLVWVIKAGRGFGKTRAGAEWVAAVMRADPAARVALVSATLDEARRVMVEGESGLLAVAGDAVAVWQASRRLLRFANGAEATLFSGASPDALRGPQHSHAWCDELAKWDKAQATWDMLQFGLRLGQRPRIVVTTTPRPGPVLSGIMARADCVTTGGRTDDNPHLPAAFVDTVRGLYAGTRLGAQELEGELLEGADGALWTAAGLEGCRRSPGFRAVRTVIGIDPPAGAGTCGIVVCARDAGGGLHVLADASVTGVSPEDWAEAAGAAAMQHGTDLAVAEVNQGGRMVAAVLRVAAPWLRVKPVRAVLNKAERAEPVALAFARGEVCLHGRFPALEAELCGMIAGGVYAGPGPSPDRADAMVWALAELMTMPAVPRVRVV